MEVALARADSKNHAFNELHGRGMVVGAIFALAGIAVHALVFAGSTHRQDLPFLLCIYALSLASMALSAATISELQQRTSMGDAKCALVWALLFGAICGVLFSFYVVAIEQLPAQTPVHSVALLLRAAIPAAGMGIATSVCSLPLSVPILIVASRFCRSSDTRSR